MTKMDLLMASMLAKMNVQEWFAKFTQDMNGGANATQTSDIQHPAEQQVLPSPAGNPAE